MPAGELFKKSPLFRYAIEFCEKHYDKTFVLTPRHGLLPLEKEVKPYDIALDNVQRRALREWLEKVAEQIRKEIAEGSELYFHSGNRFRKVIPLLEKDYKCIAPMKGMGIGQQLQFYKQQLV